MADGFKGMPLNGLTVSNQYDSLLRRTNLAVVNSSGTVLTQSVGTACPHGAIPGGLHFPCRGAATENNPAFQGRELVCDRPKSHRDG